MELTPEQDVVVQMGTSMLKGGELRSLTNKAKTFMDAYTIHVSNMLSVEKVSAQASVVYVTFAIFFHIASTDDPFILMANSTKLGKIISEEN
jgi:hypothetical protein